MQFALIDGLRSKASPGLAGVCQTCTSPVVPKCGPLRTWHWAHQGRRQCDPWWEESKWHVAWKGRFPSEWQEIILHADDGEKHIADVRTPDGRVVEFQHSRLKEDERRAREFFYKNMIWVVDGLARKRDLLSFKKALRQTNHPFVYSGHAEDCALLRDWAGRPVDVFLDFGDQAVWWLHPNTEMGLLLTPVAVNAFTEMLHKAMPFQPIRIENHTQKAPVSAVQHQPNRSTSNFLPYIRRSRRF
jgi:competence protein CoiA